jgi:hypothetical protein
MTLETAKELAKNSIDKSNIVIVTSDNAIYLLNDNAEIEVIKNHADLNKLEMFVVKSEEVIEEKPKKKK